MGFWPFGGGGKRQRVVEAEDHARDTLLRRAPSDALVRDEKAERETPSLGRTASKNRRNDISRRLSKSRTPSTTQQARTQTTPARTTEDDSRRASRTNSQYNEKSLYQQNPLSQSSLGPENFTVAQVPPTLHAKRPEHDNHLPRRKSSKRKAEDYAREREIKAMSSSPIPIPKRAGNQYSTGPLQRDSKQVPGSLNRRLERPTSEVSLPLPEALPDVDDMPNQNSFKVGLLAALSPRPTVRYDANPRIVNGKQPVRYNMAIQQAIAEEDVSDKKRIDELADDLDANGLRELMERDRRRRERKKDTDRLKLQRKLQRRAERQREEEERRARTEAFVHESPLSPEEGNADLRIDSSTTRSPVKQGMMDKDIEAGPTDPFADNAAHPAALVPASIRNPFEDEKDMDVMRNPQDSDDDVNPPVPVRSPLRDRATSDARPTQQSSQTALSPPVSPVHRAADRSSISQGSASLLGREVTPDIPENAQLERRTSDQSSQRLSSWTTFFKRGSRKYAAQSYGRKTPSEFSNTSRESFQRKQPPPTAASRTFRRSDSVTPQRTLSRFREDLPEMPMSPPDSRIQSPETTVPPAGASSSTNTGENVVTSVETAVPSRSQDIRQTRADRVSARSNKQQSMDISTGNLPMNLSQSLASVDSEGSWLSGRPPKRTSALMHANPLRQSRSSLHQSMPGAFRQDDDEDEHNDNENSEEEEEDDDDGNDDDESMDGDQHDHDSPAAAITHHQMAFTDNQKTRTLSADSRREHLDTSTPVLASPPTETKRDETWHGGLGRTPTLVRQAGRAKSTEGLLNESAANDSRGPDPNDDDENDYPDLDLSDVESPDTTIKDGPLLRARSVEYKGHIRHISAGSAKLLDIKRNSVQSDIYRPKSPGLARKSGAGQQEPSQAI